LFAKAVAVVAFLSSTVKFFRWTRMFLNLDMWKVGNRILKSQDHSQQMVSWSETAVAESGWMRCDLRLTWHPGGTVIVEEDRIVIEVKVSRHLIVVVKLNSQEMLRLLLAILKTCS
jgi:hypothetical protein